MFDPSTLDANAPDLHPDAFVASNAIVIGDVHVGARASVWFNVVIRGDMAPIRIGAGTNVQDGSILHVDDDCPLTIGEGVTIGHMCVIHGCTIGDGTLIGMGSVLMNNAVLGEDCLVGAGTLVTEGREYPPRSLILGRPGKVVRTLTDDDVRDILRRGAEHYVEAGQAYRSRGFDLRSTD